MDKATFFELIDKYQAGEVTAEEAKLVEEYYRRLETMGSTHLSAAEEEVVKKEMYQAILAGIKVPVVRRLFNWKRVAVAAALIGVIAAAGYLVFFTRTKTSINTSSSIAVKYS